MQRPVRSSWNKRHVKVFLCENCDTCIQTGNAFTTSASLNNPIFSAFLRWINVLQTIVSKFRSTKCSVKHWVLMSFEKKHIYILLNFPFCSHEKHYLHDSWDISDSKARLSGEEPISLKSGTFASQEASVVEKKGSKFVTLVNLSIEKHGLDKNHKDHKHLIYVSLWFSSCFFYFLVKHAKHKAVLWIHSQARRSSVRREDLHTMSSGCIHQPFINLNLQNRPILSISNIYTIHQPPKSSNQFMLQNIGNAEDFRIWESRSLDTTPWKRPILWLPWTSAFWRIKTLKSTAFSRYLLF